MAALKVSGLVENELALQFEDFQQELHKLGGGRLLNWLNLGRAR